MTVLFIACVLFVVYTYAGFPLWLHWRVSKKRKQVSDSVAARMGGADAGALKRSDTDWPVVTVVLAAHNEARHLPEKLRSLEALDYPAGRLEIVLISDASTDETVQICRQRFEGRDNCTLLIQETAAGKPSALNRGVAEAKGEVLVMMDARQTVSPNAIKALVSRLMYPDVGVVSGELVLATDAGEEAENVGLYWRYERWIRANESQLFSTTGATGALYAVRRVDVAPLPADTLLDDFEIPVQLLKSGHRTLFEPSAKVYDQAEASGAQEFRRKVRTLAGNYQSFSRNLWLFSPRANPVWWQFLSHKVFRLLVPLAMMIALLASLLGDGLLLDLAFWLQIAFYSLGLWALGGGGGRIAKVIGVFLQLNAAAVVGAWRAARGTAGVRWKQPA